MHSVLKWQQPNNLSINVNQTTEDGENLYLIKLIIVVSND